MNTEHYKKLLLAKEQDLADYINKHDEDARETRTSDVEDEIDRVASDEAQAENFQESSMAAETLKQVREALERIENGTYGVSLESGEPISPARLEALPWAKYTVEEQERLDQQTSGEQELDAIS